MQVREITTRIVVHSAEKDVGVEILADITLAFHDARVRNAVDSFWAVANEAWLEKNFLSTEPLGTMKPSLP